MAIVTEGELAGAVMQVAVEAAGDALISMQQREQPLEENRDGSLAVELSASGTAVLTVLASADDTLASGETKTATVRIVDANAPTSAASIRLPSPSTAAPTYPPALVGLLLQALLLAATGARLYRRRQR